MNSQWQNTKFITNEADNTLFQRFNKTLQSAEYFDALVGYFRTSGFARICESVDNVEKIRILIGLNIDKKTYDVLNEAYKQRDLFESQAAIRKEYKEEVQREFEESEDTNEVAKGVAKFRELLEAGKIEMRACREQNIHAKVYIMHYSENIPIKGSVITGSSNFTENGLNTQYEFNVELTDPADYAFASDKFNELWENSIDISEDYVDALETKTWLNDKITPYELYLKFLYEYFYDEINFEDVFDENDFPDNYLKLDYQISAIAKIKKILDEYKGVFISDVVGLGKTYIAAMLAKIVTGKILILCPPPVQENWQEAFRDFGLKAKNYKIASIGQIEKIADEVSNDDVIGQHSYDYIFVDEAHRFRNGTTSTYEQLKRICLGKKVVLISATPFNNRFFDFYYLISLFQNSVRSDIPGVSNLENYFTEKRTKLNNVLKQCNGDKSAPAYIDELKNISQQVRDDILQYIMIRRTRTDIKKYFSDDIERQGLTFPDVQEPKKIIYEFDPITNSLFNKTIKIISSQGGKSEVLTYARYKPKLYLKDVSLSAFEETQQKNNVGFTKTRLVKRLESSKFAFEKTLERSIESHQKMISMFESGTVYISKDIDVLEYIDDDTKTIDDLLEKAKSSDKELEKFKASDFNQSFIIDVKNDLKLLKELYNSWTKIGHDFKLEKFVRELEHDKLLKGHKIVVFTESADTGQNLYETLQKSYGNEVVFYCSSKQSIGLKDRIISNFDPNLKQSEQKDDMKILITTDVLSEGVNLHRSNIVINYDLPWNPTKVMQRVGRVNRIGTQHEKIYIYNFFPTSETDEELGLEENIIAKIQAFHQALGEDSKYLSDTEETGSVDLAGEQLYHDLNSLGDFEDAEESPELKYVKIIKEIKEKNRNMYVRIADLPKKIRVARDSKEVDKNSLITFFRKGKLRKLFVTDGTTTSEVVFANAIKYFECTEDIPKKQLPIEYFNLLLHNKECFGKPIDTEPTKRKAASKLSNIIAMLTSIHSSPQLTRDDKTYLSEVLKAFHNRNIPEIIQKKLNDFLKNEIDDVKALEGIRKLVPDIYLKISDNLKNNNDGKREIVLSEFLYKEK